MVSGLQVSIISILSRYCNSFVLKLFDTIENDISPTISATLSIFGRKLYGLCPEYRHVKKTKLSPIFRR
ncbi:hypothetical protein ACE6H2_025911 [Prunus campanulata]